MGAEEDSAADSRPPLVAVAEVPKGGRNSTTRTPSSAASSKFDRLLMSASTYPTDYGYIPDTFGGTVLDALVCLSEPIFPAA